MRSETNRPHLQLVLLLLGDLGEQLGLLSGQRLDQRVTLRHEAGFKLHAALLKQRHKREHDEEHAPTTDITSGEGAGESSL